MEMGEGKIPLIGIAGGIASGKSMISDALARRGAAVISADRLAHEVLAFDEVKQALQRRWGERVFAVDGQVDRQAVARVVFAATADGQRELAFLEQLTHPAVGRLAMAEVERLNREKSCAVIVMDVPLLFESGWNRWCDRIVFVDAPREQRLRRALARGWTEEDFSCREARQESLETKKKLADVVIDNSDTRETAQAQVEQVWPDLISTPVAR
jgi:dephospho-CoA kinase